jgi:hypothetical protein
MWYPEILNRMSHYVIDHPQNDVGLCNAILEEDDLDSFNSTEVVHHSISVFVLNVPFRCRIKCAKTK